MLLIRRQLEPRLLFVLPIMNNGKHDKEILSNAEVRALAKEALKENQPSTLTIGYDQVPRLLSERAAARWKIESELARALLTCDDPVLAIETFETILRAQPPRPASARLQTVGRLALAYMVAPNPQYLLRARELFDNWVVANFSKRQRDEEWTEIAQQAGALYAQLLNSGDATAAVNERRVLELLLDTFNRSDHAEPVRIWSERLALNLLLYETRSRRADLERAIELLKRATAIAEDAGDKTSLARNLPLLSEAYRERVEGMPSENAREALNYALQARAFVDAAISSQARSTIEQQVVSAIKGGVATGIVNEDVIRKEMIRISAMVAEGTATTAHDIACLHVRWADLAGAMRTPASIEEAISHYEMALKLLRKGDAEYYTAANGLGIAYFMRSRGDPGANIEESIRVVATALQDVDPGEDQVGWCCLATTLANAYRQRIDRNPKNIDRALDLFAQVRSLRSPDIDPERWAGAAFNSAGVLVARASGDDLKEALALVDRGLLIIDLNSAKWTSGQQQRGRVLMAIASDSRAADVQGVDGEADEAVAAYERALEAASQTKHSQELAAIHEDLGICQAFRARRDPRNAIRAIQAFDAAISIWRSEEYPRDFSRCSLARGGVWFGQGEWQQAQRDYEHAAQALSRQQSLSSLESTSQMTLADCAKAFTYAGYCAAKAGSLECAALHFERSLSQQLDVLINRDLALKRAEELGAELDMDALPTDKEDPGAALAIERAREIPGFGGFLGMITDVAESIPEARPDASREEKLRRFALAARRSRALEPLAKGVQFGLVSGDTPGSPSPPVDELRLRYARMLANAHAELEVALQGVEDIPEVACMMGPATTDIMESAVSCGEPIVYLAHTSQGGLALFLRRASPGHAVYYEACWCSEISDVTLINELYGPPGIKEETSDSWFGSYRHFLSRPEQFSNTIQHKMSWLWNTVVGALVDRLIAWGEKRICLIPGGMLNFLPLHAAQRAEQGAVQHAVDILEINYAPSAKALGRSRAIAKEYDEVQRVLTVSEPATGRPSSLPLARAECALISAFFVQMQSLSGSDANRPAVRAALQNCDVAHFSCHGVNDWSDPLNSHLLVADDVPFALRDLFLLRRSAVRLASLSSCETAVVGIHSLNERLSLPTGFLRAGFAAVVATLWPVEDTAASTLMVRFYDLWRRTDRRPHQALREAQQWLRDSTRAQKRMYFENLAQEFSEVPNATDAALVLRRQYLFGDPAERQFSDPLYWAPFQLFGV